MHSHFYIATYPKFNISFIILLRHTYIYLHMLVEAHTLLILIVQHIVQPFTFNMEQLFGAWHQEIERFFSLLSFRLSPPLYPSLPGCSGWNYLPCLQFGRVGDIRLFYWPQESMWLPLLPHDSQASSDWDVIRLSRSCDYVSRHVTWSFPCGSSCLLHRSNKKDRAVCNTIGHARNDAVMWPTGGFH